MNIPEDLYISPDEKKLRLEKEAINFLLQDCRNRNKPENPYKPENGYKVPELETPEKKWRPLGDGQKVWLDPDGYTAPVGDVPDEYLEEITKPE